MKRVVSILGLFFILFSTGFSQIPPGYYDSAAGLTGNALKSALNNIISGHTVYPYTSTATDVWDILKETDRDPLNPANVILLYTGWSVNAAQEYNSGAGWTREHCWPKSHGFPLEEQPAYTDCHHLRPADVSVNSARNNRWYAECNEQYFDDGGTIPTDSWTSSTQWVWKPRDAVKGDCARMIFYMATRYEGEYNATEGIMEIDLEIMDFIPADDNDPNPIMAVLSDLLAWNEQDPPDNFERNRNEVVYAYQGNRNPYIDHPEYVCLVFGSNCPGNVANPDPFTAMGTSSTQVDLNWGLNANSNSVVLAYNTTNTFGTPTGTYTANDPVTGGGTVLYVGNATTFNHTGLLPQMYYYKMWSFDAALEYSSGVTANASPVLPEPTYDPTNFIVTSSTYSSLDLSWTDVTTGVIPAGYLIKASTGIINDPIDGTPEPNGTFVKNIAQGVESVSFGNLNPNTLYYFKIYPYTNSGSFIDYKISSPSFTSGITDDLPLACASDLLISEYGEGSGYNKYIEIFNNTGYDINLADYRLVKGTNGAPFLTMVSLTGTIEDNKVFIVCYDGTTYHSDPSILVLADMTSTSIIFNGDDAIGLQKTTDGGLAWSTIDVIGVETVDPGTGWPVAGVPLATIDHTLVRKSTVVSGNTNWASSAGTNETDSEWIVLGKDDFSELGTHYLNCESIYRYTWQGDDAIYPNDWQTAENWDKGSVPGVVHNVVVPVVAHFPIIDDGLSTAVCHDITVNSGAILTIAPNGQMTVSGDFTNYAGVGGILIQSDATGDGSLICSNPVSASVERFLPSTTVQWNFVSSPVNSSSFSVFPSTSNLFEYNEATNDYWTSGTYDAGSVLGWTSPTGTLLPGKGYIWYYDQTTLQFNGNLNGGVTGITLNVPYTDHAGTAPNGTDYDNYDGYALLGNPYPCSLDWELTDVSNNLSTTIYYYDNSIDNYATYTKGGLSTNGGSRYIPAMKGFTVKANVGGGTLTIPYSARVHDNTSTFEKSNSELSLLKLKIRGNGFYDETIIIPSKYASDQLDAGMDAYKMLSFNDSVPQLFSRDYASNSILAVNYTGPMDSSKVIPLSFSCVEGDFQLSVSEENITEADYLYLEDAVKGTFVDLNQVTNYHFTHEGGRSDDRFFVHLGVNHAPVLKNKIEDQTVTVNSYIEFTISDHTFSDPDINDFLQIDASRMPKGLVFDSKKWLFYGILSSGSEQTYTIDVTATDKFGALTRTDFKLNVLHTSEIETIREYAVYPNPSDGIVCIESFSNCVITITDISGKTLYTSRHTGNISYLDLSRLNPGIYILYIDSGNYRYHEKIVLR